MSQKNSLCNNLEAALSQGEYEAQFFVSAIVCLTYPLKQLIKSYLEKSIQSIEKTLEKRCDNKELLQTALENVKLKFQNVFEEHCKEMEVKLFDIFQIPEHVLLPEDVVQRQQYSQSDEQKLDEEINELKNRYKKACLMEMMLKDEKDSNKDLDTLRKTSMMINEEVTKVVSSLKSHEECFSKLQKQFADIQKLRQMSSFLFEK